MSILLYFGKGVLEELERIRYEDPRRAVQKKAEALILHFHGLSVEKIAAVIGACPDTVRSYFHEFKATGLEGFRLEKKRPKTGELYHYRDLIEQSFRQLPPSSAAEASQRIEDLTGLKRGKTQVRVFLKEIGMAWRKTALIPAKVDHVQQEAFKKKWTLS